MARLHKIQNDFMLIIDESLSDIDYAYFDTLHLLKFKGLYCLHIDCSFASIYLSIHKGKYFCSVTSSKFGRSTIYI